MEKNLKKYREILEKKKNKLDAFRPLAEAVVNNLNEWFTVELAHNSTEIEGNTLTKRETVLVVEKGLTIAGKSVKEHLEIINYAHALDYIKDLAKKKRKEITLNDILDIHRIVLKGIDKSHAGSWRKVSVSIAGSDRALPNPIKVPDMMQEFIEWLNKTDEFAVQVAAQAHFKLVAIHPFVDGNGRTVRLLMNLLLIQDGYPPAIIEVKKRKEYIDAIAHAEQTGNLDGFYHFIYQAEDKSLDKYLDAAEKCIDFIENNLVKVRKNLLPIFQTY